MKKYLIVLDLDDTLLRSDQTISTYTKTILKKCQQLGNKIVVSTARSYIRAVGIAKEINADYICAFNGNFVCTCNEDVIYNRAMPLDISKKAIEEFSQYTTSIINEGLYVSFCTNKDDINFLDSKYASLEFLSNVQSYKIIARCSPEEFYSFKAIANKYNLSITFSREKNTIRILPMNSDKWEGIEKIKGLLGKDYSVMAFGDDITDLNTLRKADIGVRMKNSVSEIIEAVGFITDSNDDDGVANFLCHYYNLEEDQINYDNIKILDCSLRDGGHLNKSRFGQQLIKKIVRSLISAKIDIVEVGFLQDADFDDDVAIYPSVSCANNFLTDVETNDTIISLLTQVDKFDISKLEYCSGKVKMIRVSFHADLIDLGMRYCEIVKEKGYLCSVNPINFSQYSSEQIVSLITKVNEINPYVFSIVDTFGVMLSKDFRNKLNLINHLLNRNINKGIHLHDNLNQAFASAQTLIETNSSECQVIIDSSVAGIGRAPGNLLTELIAYYINVMQKKERYKLENVYMLLEEQIPELKKSLDWKKDFAYCISAFEKSHRTYAEYLLSREFSLADIERFIKMLPGERRGRFNETIISEICFKKKLRW